MEIIYDDVTLTGEQVITKDVKDVSVTTYFVFTASSISEASEVTISTDVNDAEWEPTVAIVMCTDDTTNQTYAIRVICPYFSTTRGDTNVRTVTVDGTIYTNNSNIFSPVHVVVLMSGCQKS